MLYPKENAARGIIDLGGVWNFKLGDETDPGETCSIGSRLRFRHPTTTRRMSRHTGIITAGFTMRGKSRFRLI